MPRPAILLLGVLAFLSALFYQPISRYAIVQGYYRRPDQIKAYHGLDLRIIPNSMQCEDMHLDKSSGLIFAACQTGNPMARYQWWPPLGLFSMKGGQGTIVVIDTRVRIALFCPHSFFFCTLLSSLCPLASMGLQVADSGLLDIHLNRTEI